LISRKGLLRLTVLFASLSWLILLIADLFLLFAEQSKANAGITKEIPFLFLSLFVIFVFLYFRLKTQKAESINFIDLLWRVFSIGLITSIIQLIIGLLFYLLSNSKLLQNSLTVNFFYHITIASVSIFLISTFITWKRLILYQKNKRLLFIWQFFEYGLLASLLYSFFDSGFQQWIFTGLLGAFMVFGLVLSFNLKWIAYLNFKQKWRSILLLTLVLLYLYYFVNNLFSFSQEFKLSLDLLDSVFVLSVIGFISLYAIISILVILFNLPTSSVFEQKIGEVLNFQRLSQSIQKGENKNQVYEVLLESSINAVFAKSAWVEIIETEKSNDEDIVKTSRKILSSNIDEHEILEVKQRIKERGIYSYLDKQKEAGFKKDVLQNKLISNISDPNFASALVMPLVVQNKEVGVLTILKDVSDGFNKEMFDIISSFANQACISLENFELLSEALENERYREELKIASRVQKSLLPSKLICNDKLEMFAFYTSADEVGGDYYDYYQIDEDHVAVIIGDVSGKGTSAAFHMAQMKGIFHSLVQLNFDPKTFLIKANHALAYCLEKTSFITAAFYNIDTSRQLIQLSRAGHCPALFYESSSKSTNYFQNKGLGLGIVRNDSFQDYMEMQEVSYKPNDMLILYTDGIVEAKNTTGEEFGYERLAELIEQNAGYSPKIIKEKVIETLFQFTSSEGLDDDYTLLIIRFL
jgi:sigma-B regulation protein RsbU (phosphoserine phosphatase)